MPLTPPCDDAGRPIDDEQYDRLTEREYRARDSRPSDCVRAVPLGGGRVQLIGFDRSGAAIASLTLPASQVTGMDELWLLDRVRRLPPSRPALRITG